MTALDPRLALARSPLFAGVADPEPVLALARPTSHDEGTLLLRAGQPADRCHLLLSGRVALGVHVAGRGDLVVETLAAGDAVGVSWARPDAVWDLDGHVTRAAEALTFPGDGLRALAAGTDPLADALRTGIVNLLAARLHATRLRLVDLYREELGP